MFKINNNNNNSACLNKAIERKWCSVQCWHTAWPTCMLTYMMGYSIRLEATYILMKNTKHRFRRTAESQSLLKHADFNYTTRCLLVTDVRSEILKQQQQKQGYKRAGGGLVQRQKTFINVTAETHRWSKRDEVGKLREHKAHNRLPRCYF